MMAGTARPSTCALRGARAAPRDRVTRAVAVLATLAAVHALPLAAQLERLDHVRSVRAPHGMVVAEHPLASEIGRDVLAAGGNAVDAAIATGFALVVTHPAAGNIGGGGFMMIRFPDGRVTAMDFRERAPAAAHAEMFVENGEYSADLHQDSHLAVGVPGTVAGFDKAHRLYGSMNWERLVYPSVALAEDGFQLSEVLASSLARFVHHRPAYSATVRAFSNAGEPYEPGDVWRQPDLATTLWRIMLERRDGFYRGETARPDRRGDAPRRRG